MSGSIVMSLPSDFPTSVPYEGDDDSDKSWCDRTLTMGSHGAKSFGKSVHLILSTTLRNRVYYPHFTDEIVAALNHSPQSMWLVNGRDEIWTQDLLMPESVLFAHVESHLHGGLCKRIDPWLLSQGSLDMGPGICVWSGCGWFKMAVVGTPHVLIPRTLQRVKWKIQGPCALSLGSLCAGSLTFFSVYCSFCLFSLEQLYWDNSHTIQFTHLRFTIQRFLAYLQSCKVITTFNHKLFSCSKKLCTH